MIDIESHHLTLQQKSDFELARIRTHIFNQLNYFHLIGEVNSVYSIENGIIYTVCLLSDEFILPVLLLNNIPDYEAVKEKVDSGSKVKIAGELSLLSKGKLTYLEAYEISTFK